MSRSEFSWRRRWAELARLAAAVCVIPAGFAIMLTVGGAWESFWNSYFVDNIAYLDASVKSASETVESRIPFLLSSRAWCMLIAASLAVTVVALEQTHLRDSRRRWPLILAFGFLAASIPFTLFVNRYAHYLLFMVMPAVALAGVALADAWLTRGTARSRRCLLIGMFAAALVIQVITSAVQKNPFLAEMSGAQPVPQEVSRTILREVASGDRMAV